MFFVVRAVCARMCARMLSACACACACVRACVCVSACRCRRAPVHARARVCLSACVRAWAWWLCACVASGRNVHCLIGLWVRPPQLWWNECIWITLVAQRIYPTMNVSNTVAMSNIRLTSRMPIGITLDS